MLSEEKSDLILLKVKEVHNINSVVFIDFFNDLFDLCGYPLAGKGRSLNVPRTKPSNS
jgi:hypothetical protein